MEDILDVYKRSYDETHPLICMDESCKQRIKEVRSSIPAKPGSVEKYDTEYERNGVSHLFMFFEPLAGQRHVAVTDQRTAVDWAHQIQHLVDGLYPQAEQAKRILDKLDIHYTPKHGSWLNRAKIELSILSRQCLDRRLPEPETLIREIAAWQEKRNAGARPMDWRFTTEDTRIKLKKLYPTLQK